MDMIARFPGKCRECGGRIKRGERIDWTRRDGAAHSRCTGQQQPEGLRPGYTTAAMAEDEATFEAMAGESFMSALRSEWGR